MQSLEIKVPDGKTRLVKELFAELGIIIVRESKDMPNQETIDAMNELKSGSGRKFKSVSELFKSV